jgi:hypothetical protein
MKPLRKKLTKALERRVIMEAGAKCPWFEDGKKLEASETEIHHIDGDRAHNSLENLILTCRNHHGQIESSLIPAWEVMFKKTCLSNPATLERLGLKPVGPVPTSSQKKRAKKSLSVNNNPGIMAGTINNTGTMAGTINVPQLPKGPIQVVGSLATSVDHYGYVEYLVKRLSHYRSWRPGGGAPPDNPGVVRKIFEREMGRLPKDFPLDRFDDAVTNLLTKIKNTTLGRMGKAKTSSFEQWKQKGRPKK